MISRISGQLISTDLTDLTVDVNGVGYALTVPLSTYDQLPPAGENVTLFVHTHVREDAIVLFAFATQAERQLFRLLQTVSGIGNRLALNILSSMSAEIFARHVAEGNSAALAKINGLGKKSAERLIVELGETFRKLLPESGFGGQESAPALPPGAEDAMAALQTLGFKPEQARKSIREISKKLSPEEQTSENLIRRALASLNS